MSAVHGIAWGIIEREEVERNFQYWRREVRRELRTHRIRLIPQAGHYRLERKTKKSGHKRIAVHAFGNFFICCQTASHLIAPPNQETQT